MVLSNALLAARRTATATLRRHLSTPAPAASTGMTLNFNLPQETLYSGAAVDSGVVPGAMGEYEVTADHVPIVAELKAGTLTIKAEGGEEKYFVPGGFSLTHEGSTTVSWVRVFFCVGQGEVPMLGRGHSRGGCLCALVIGR